MQAVVAERVTSLLEAKLRDRDSLKTERSQRFVPLGQSLAENEDESALIAMLLDDYYQQTLHAPALPTSTPRESAKPQLRPPAGRGRGPTALLSGSREAPLRFFGLSWTGVVHPGGGELASEQQCE